MATTKEGFVVSSPAGVLDGFAGDALKVCQDLGRKNVISPERVPAIVEAIKVCGNSKGLASAPSIRAMIMTDHPDLPKMVLKKAMTKAIEQGMVTQVKGNGFSGSFKLGKGKPAVKKAADGKKGAKKVS